MSSGCKNKLSKSTTKLSRGAVSDGHASPEISKPGNNSTKGRAFTAQGGVNPGPSEVDGNTRPTRTPVHVSVKTAAKTKCSSSSRDSSPTPTFIRSNSFTKDKPSGVVPDSEIPHVRLNRCSSFTKSHPELPEEMIPRISSDDGILDVDTSLDTSLLMKDTEVVGTLLVLNANVFLIYIFDSKRFL